MTPCGQLSPPLTAPAIQCPSSSAPAPVARVLVLTWSTAANNPSTAATCRNGGSMVSASAPSTSGKIGSSRPALSDEGGGGVGTGALLGAGEACGGWFRDVAVSLAVSLRVGRLELIYLWVLGDNDALLHDAIERIERPSHDAVTATAPDCHRRSSSYASLQSPSSSALVSFNVLHVSPIAPIAL